MLIWISEHPVEWKTPEADEHILNNIYKKVREQGNANDSDRVLDRGWEWKVAQRGDGYTAVNTFVKTQTHLKSVHCM